VKEHIRGK